MKQVRHFLDQEEIMENHSSCGLWGKLGEWNSRPSSLQCSKNMDIKGFVSVGVFLMNCMSGWFLKICFASLFCFFFVIVLSFCYPTVFYPLFFVNIYPSLPPLPINLIFKDPFQVSEDALALKEFGSSD